jgi:hypothetical protein
MKQASLPQLDACLDLSETAYSQHGTESFAATDLEWDAADAEKEHLLELAVAYGLLSFDRTVYRLTCAPDAPAERWETAIDDRAGRVKRAITNHFDSPDTHSETAERAPLTYEGEEYASVTVEEVDEFEAVVEAVSAVELVEWAGVVLRSPGEYANEVQRFADRLCDASELADVPFSAPFTKEYSDVRGTDKDELEFRVFLSKP